MTLKGTAFHEAGHAVLAALVSRPFRLVTIEPQEDSLGHVRYYRWPASLNPENSMAPRTRLRCEDAILTALAGPQAERLHAGRWNRVGASGDHEAAADFALRVCGSEESTNAYLKWLEVRTRETLLRHWCAVEALAAALLDRKTLKGAHARRIIDAALMAG